MAIDLGGTMVLLAALAAGSVALFALLLIQARVRARRTTAAVDAKPLAEAQRMLFTLPRYEAPREPDEAPPAPAAVEEAELVPAQPAVS
jgi:hypothetical protein